MPQLLNDASAVAQHSIVTVAVARLLNLMRIMAKFQKFNTNAFARKVPLEKLFNVRIEEPSGCVVVVV